MSPDFSVDSFIASTRSTMTLDQLQTRLVELFGVLRNSMVELINKDYVDFVNLSTKLVGLDKAIAKLTVPLGQLKTDVEEIKGEIDTEIVKVDSRLQQHLRTREDKALLQRFLAISTSLEKLEKMMKSTGSEDPFGDDAGKMLGMASELNQLLFSVGQCRDLPFAAQALPRIDALRRVLEAALADRFARGVAARSTELMAQCIRTFAIIDKMDDALRLFRSLVAAPAVAKIVTKDCVGAAGEGLDAVLSGLLAWLRDNMAVIRCVTGAATKGIDLLVDAVWPEIVDSLMTKCSSIFSSGVADVFHRNYTAMQGFVDGVEQQCGTLAAVTRLRASPALAALRKRWSLPVYFQLRFQEIAGQFEATLMDGFGLAEADSIDEVKSRPAAMLLVCVRRCWAPDVFVPALAHRFLKLSFQLVSRLAAWTGTLTCDGKSLTISDCITLERDAHKLSTVFPALVHSLMAPLLRAPPAAMAALAGAIEDALQHLDGVARQARMAAESHLTGQAVTVALDGARAIPRLYRRTGKEMPSTPSGYLETMFEQLHAFARTARDVLPADQLAHVWLLPCVKIITDKYLAGVNEVLVSVRKTEENLIRLKKMRGSQANVASGPDAGATDEDKIRAQLREDIKNFSVQVNLLGVSPADVPSIAELNVLLDARPADSRTEDI